MARHTSGDWRLTGNANGGFSIEDERGRVLCQRSDWTTNEPESAANGRLIAAAPDLLAALKGVMRVADRATDEFDAARAAIAKAEQS
jgi:hypothetical protein